MSRPVTDEVDFEEWKKRPRRPGPPRHPDRRTRRRRRPRHPDEWTAMHRMVAERRRLYLACGKLKPLPGGGWEYELGMEKLVAWLEKNG